MRAGPSHRIPGCRRDGDDEIRQLVSKIDPMIATQEGD
jgi:hypothetical protein